MVAACGALAALHERLETGKGQHIDISVQEVAFSRNVNGVLVLAVRPAAPAARRRRGELWPRGGAVHLAAARTVTVFIR